MKPILVVNSGSSSLKYQVVDVEQGKSLLTGLIERVTDHQLAFEEMVLNLKQHDVVLGAIGHRVVHGGSKFSEPVLINQTVIDQIEELVPLAPLHNPGNLSGIRSAIRAFPGLPQVAVFDTAFHQSMPAASYTYAIDSELARKYGIRRYGFHGSSHSFVSKRAAELMGREKFTGIVLHLGSGASACAIKDGKSVNTSMGLTPLQGLVMGTRSGDIDPAIVAYLTSVAGMTVSEIDQMLNQSSGLKGLTGDSDLRDVLQRAKSGDSSAELAIDIYALRVKHYIGAYLAELGRVDAIVFTAGVGENSAAMRRMICHGLEHLGIVLDDAKNQESAKHARVISKQDSPIQVLVVPTDEELEIAIQTAELSY